MPRIDNAARVRQPVGSWRLAIIGVSLVLIGLGCVTPGDKPAEGSAIASAQDPIPASAAVSSQEAVTGQAARDPPPPSLASESDPVISGYLKTRYWARWTSDDSDHDLYETLYFDIGDPVSDPVTVHFMGRASADLDGTSNPDIFFNITDTYDSRVNGRLYDAYVDFGNAISVDTARLGRQQIYETPVVAYFDGLLLQSEQFWDTEVQLGAYCGVPVALFESSSQGDSIFGTFAQARPWTGGRLRADYMYMDEEFLGINDLKDELLGVGAWQNIADSWQVEGQYSMLNWDSRDFRINTRYYDLESDFTAQVNYYNLLKPQRQQVLELDPFFNSLFEYFPFQQLGILATKGFGEHVNLQGGVDVRRVTDTDNVGTFNRDYERVFLTAGFQEVLWNGFGFSVTGDLWDSDEQDINTVALTLNQSLSDSWSLSAGSFYSLYKFDVLTGTERNDIRTYYFNVRHQASRQWVFDFNFNYEDAELVDYYGLILGVTWRF